MSYGMVTVPAAPVRRKARHQAEMVNQLLFGDAVRILREKKSGWLKIRGLQDQYEGWIHNQQITATSEEQAMQRAEYISTDAFSAVLCNGQRFWIPAGSLLPGLEGRTLQIGETSFELELPPAARQAGERTEERLRQISMAWLRAPYLWGGKTMMGVDCSGFVQVCFRIWGIDLPRDAWQQAQEGSIVPRLKNAVAGDLAFFDDKDEIVHVGILLSKDQIIHASGRVRIDSIDKKGIIHAETGKRTHSLRVIKRTGQV